jgi:hypothetical protein
MPPHATRATTRSAASAATLSGKSKASAKKKAVDDEDNEFLSDKYKSGSGIAGVHMPQDDLDVETKDADFGPTADSPDYRRQVD